MVLFFSLSQNSLQIYNKKYVLECSIYSITSDDRALSLHDKFELIWNELYERYISNCSEIVLIIKPKASFTDTRIISMWCRTHTMFNQNTTFKIIKEQDWADLTIKNTEIIYSQAPKIGSKI